MDFLKLKKILKNWWHMEKVQIKNPSNSSGFTKTILRNRVDWDQYFMSIAHLVSVRSHDEQTQVGCVIVNSEYHIVSVGYNGFPAGTKDESLPRVRPGKYPFMLHAEQNAISNMLLKGLNLKAYVTAHPCSTCSKLLWQNGVREIVIDSKGVFYSMNSDDLNVINFLMDNGLKIREIEFNNGIFKDINDKLKARGNNVN